MIQFWVIFVNIQQYFNAFWMSRGIYSTFNKFFYLIWSTPRWANQGITLDKKFSCIVDCRRIIVSLKSYNNQIVQISFLGASRR